MKEWRFPPVPGAPEPPAPSPAETSPIPAPAPAEPTPRAEETPPEHAVAPAPFAAPSSKPRRRRVVLFGLAALAFGFLLAVAIFALRLYPWVAMPSEPRAAIEQRWHKVTELAKVRGGSGEESMLLEAAQAFRSMSPPGDATRVARSTLTEEQSKALDTLVHWHTEHGGFAERSCKDADAQLSRGALPMFRLGQMALLAAEGANDRVLVEAVLDMASQARRKGRLVEFAVGAELAQKAAEWSRDRGVAFPPAFNRFRPTVDELRRAMARDAVCVASLIEGEGLSRAPPRFSSGAGARPPLGIVRMNRERLLYQQEQGRLIERSIALGDDWKGIADLYDAAAQSHPKSVVLDMTLVTGAFVRKAGQNVARYDELVPRR